jgi:hypothetical protein
MIGKNRGICIMYNYGFNKKAELKDYRKIGSIKGFSNYCDWEDSVLEKYQSITEPRFILNLKATLNRECRQCEHYKESMLSLLIPLLAVIFSLALTLPTSFISLKQYQDGLESDTNNTRIENLIRAKVETDTLIENQVKLLQNRFDQLRESADYVFSIIFLFYGIILVYGVYSSLKLKDCLVKIDFYQDYIILLDKVIKTKSKEIDLY